ncbi:MAG TPA: bifunctional diaminohydroxyphosphoribosylaminopyrimidine deaminase/5-amino-6-(5-phosphoribosylamino)uracil reductase RibD [Parasegetibacter sp.]
MDRHELYMKRCLQLARQGVGYVAPNPLVGAVLVHADRVIGEGYHACYGQAHAEVNCLNSVKEDDKFAIAASTLYVSLEPCAHFGKTPPCADLIINSGIKKVVIGCKDSFSKVDGKGIEKLKQAGTEVVVGVLEKECIELNRRFFCFHNKKRPYIILKWAQSSDGLVGQEGRRIAISNELTNRLVHKWRSAESGIMVGSKTALDDNPLLTNRHWTGKNPVRMVSDRYLKLHSGLHLMDNQVPTLVFNLLESRDTDQMKWVKLKEGTNWIQQIMDFCYNNGIQSILVEGGPALTSLFLEEGIWDEARIITNTRLILENGIAAPRFSGVGLLKSEMILNDKIEWFRPLPSAG